MAEALVVDDDDDFLKFVALSLERAGHGVRLANSAFECLAMLEEAVPDLIIIDIFMPDMDGFELIGAIRNHGNLRRWSHGTPPRIIATTGGGAWGMNGTPILHTARSIGANETLAKPCTTEALLATVALVLDQPVSPG